MRISDWSSDVCSSDLACTAATSWSDGNAGAFFDRYFETIQVGDGAAFATGYFEPEIDGSHPRQRRYETTIYRRPPDLVDVDLGQFSETSKGKRLRGKVRGMSFVPYEDRAAIRAGAVAGRGPGKGRESTRTYT